MLPDWLKLTITKPPPGLVIGPPATLADEFIPMIEPVADIEFEPFETVPDMAPLADPAAVPSVVRFITNESLT